jgi:replicative DNA helicase
MNIHTQTAHPSTPASIIGQSFILDHLHKIRAADRYRGDPTAEIGEISNACAALAKELDIGVLALCQLSRKTE